MDIICINNVKPLRTTDVQLKQILPINYTEIVISPYSRLSKLMSSKLQDDNPNIADLSDKNRPTKLAERYTELYDNQWTDAFQQVTSYNEQEIITNLREILRVILSTFTNVFQVNKDVLLCGIR